MPLPPACRCRSLPHSHMWTLPMAPPYVHTLSSMSLPRLSSSVQSWLHYCKAPTRARLPPAHWITPPHASCVGCCPTPNVVPTSRTTPSKEPLHYMYPLRTPTHPTCTLSQDPAQLQKIPSKEVTTPPINACLMLCAPFLNNCPIPIAPQEKPLHPKGTSNELHPSHFPCAPNSSLHLEAHSQTHKGAP
jgi:hypothetical protein